MARDDEILRDPLQGYDIKVQTSNNQLVGAFTSLMFKVVNQTETYLPLNSRIPRMLDGEIIVVWSLEQGLVNTDIVSNTFGPTFAEKFGGPRGTLIPRAQRFNVNFRLNSGDDWTVAGGDEKLNTGSTASTYGTDLQVDLMVCRVDTYSFGVTAGRHVVANAWQGTCQHIVVTQPSLS